MLLMQKFVGSNSVAYEKINEPFKDVSSMSRVEAVGWVRRRPPLVSTD